MGLAGLCLILIINVRLEEGSIGCVCGGGGGEGGIGILYTREERVVS